MSPRPYRLTERVKPEVELHTEVAALLRKVVLPPAEWTTFPAGSVPLPEQYGQKLSRLGLKRGWPDVLIVHDGQVFALELKRKGGGLSKTRLGRSRSGAPRMLEGQEDVFPRLERAGMRIAVCTDTDEVLAALARWQIPCRIRALVEMAA